MEHFSWERDVEGKPEREKVVGETEREWEYVEITPEELASLGWKIYPRTDGHVFTPLIRQDLDLARALETGLGLKAKHQMKKANGELGLDSPHRDLLVKGKLGNSESMWTDYDPAVGHTPFMVLVQA